MLVSLEDISLITIINHRGDAVPLIEAAQAAGALFGTIIEARGFTQSRRRILRDLTISPAIEKIMLYAESKHTHNIIQTCIQQSGIGHSSFGAVIHTSPVKLLASAENLATNFSVTANAACDFPVTAKSPVQFAGEPFPLQKNLRLITCICQRGKADKIARAAVNAGSTAPIIYFAKGHGVRERMGLLRIALNPEKELINVITGEMEAFHVYDAMVDAGSFYTPGMGYIYITDIQEGYVNLHSTLSDSHTEATVEQIVKAIDDIKGTKNWRLSKTGFTSVSKAQRPTRYDLINLKVITRRELGDEFVDLAFAAGVPGASRYYASLVGSQKVRCLTGKVINDEREIIDFNLPAETAALLVEKFSPIIEESKTLNTFISEIRVPKALKRQRDI